MGELLVAEVLPEPIAAAGFVKFVVFDCRAQLIPPMTWEMNRLS